MRSSSSTPSLRTPLHQKKLKPLARAEFVQTGQHAIVSAAEEMIAGIEKRMAEQQINEEKETAAAASMTTKRKPSAAIPPAIRRRGDAALKSLLITLDARVPVPLASLPPPVNTSVLLNEQAYAGSIRRLRNVVEQFPSTFKTLHAHVNSTMKKDEPDPALAANLYSFGTASVIRERETASPEQASPSHRKTSSPTRPDSRGPTSPQQPHQVRFVTHVVEGQIPASMPYNRYGTQRPAIVDAYRQFHKTVEELPPMRNPHPNRDWKTSAVSSTELNPDLMGRVQPASPPPAGPIVLSRDQPPQETLPKHIDFSYTPHELALKSALANLPMPLMTIQPKMFAYTYSPAIIHKKSHEVIGPDGKITTAAQGYSASERVALLVDDFRNEYKQASANQAWLQGFRTQHEAEKKAAKSKHAKEVWRQAMMENGFNVDEQEKARRPSSSSKHHHHHKPRPDGSHLAVPGASVHASRSGSRSASPTGSRRPSRRSSLKTLHVPGGSPNASVPPTRSPSRRPSRPVSPDPSPEKASSKLHSPSNEQARSPSGSPQEGRSRRGSVRPPAIDTSKVEPSGEKKEGEPDSETPSPTTPEGFYFASKLTSASYNRKRMERDLGLAPEPHEYDSEVEEWIHGVETDDASGSHSSSDSEAAAERELAAHEARTHEERMEQMLREVMERHKDLHAKSTQYSAVLPKRSRKVLNAARFVMSNSNRKKSRLAPGEAYARGDGRVSAAQEWEMLAKKRKEKEELQLELLRTQHFQQKRVQATSDSKAFFVGSHHSTQKQAKKDPDAPHEYVTVEPAWLRHRPDYRDEFLPRAFEQMCLNSMEKPLIVRTKMETENIAKWLKTLPYIREFASNPSLQAELVALCRLHPLKKDEVLWKRGDPVTHLYLLISGELKSIHTPATVSEDEFSLHPSDEMPQELMRLMRRTSMRRHQRRRSMQDRLMLAAATEGKLITQSLAPFQMENALSDSIASQVLNPHSSFDDPSQSSGGDGTAESRDGHKSKKHARNPSQAVEFANVLSPTRNYRFSLVKEVKDHGESAPGAVVSFLKPRIMFGQSKEQQLQREADEKLARKMFDFLSPAQRRWQLIRERVTPKKHLQSSFQSAEALEQLGGNVAQQQQPDLKPGQESRNTSPGKKERISKEALAARVRSDTVVGVQEENILISINQSDHDRILKLSAARQHRTQTLLLKSMRMFQHDQEKHGNVQQWKTKHLVQLVGHVENLVFERGALLGEEDELQHMVYFVVSGHVHVYKDIELITQSRLPTHTNEWTLLEHKKFMRLHVGTKGKGDCIAEECIAGCAKLDFTYKASSRVEVLGLRRAHFLPFFRAQRLADIKSRVSSARSEAVNLINKITPDLLPGNARENLGVDATAPHANEQVVDEKRHQLHVNMLETHLTDLLGEDDSESYSSLQSPKQRRRRGILTPPHSPLLRSMSQTSLPNVSTGLMPAATVISAAQTVEKRPHSPTKYNVGVKLPVTLQHTVTPNKRLAPSASAVALTPAMLGSALHVQAQDVQQLQAQLTTPKGKHAKPSSAASTAPGNSASSGLKGSAAAASRVLGRGKDEAAPPQVNLFFSTFAV